MENDDAVSPVIGVILMVAITVILAAVIAMFGLYCIMNGVAPIITVILAAVIMFVFGMVARA